MNSDISLSVAKSVVERAMTMKRDKKKSTGSVASLPYSALFTAPLKIMFFNLSLQIATVFESASASFDLWVFWKLSLCLLFSSGHF